MRPYLLALALAASAPLQAQWQLQDAHTTADLRGIDSLGNGVAWASGSNGTVLRTEDAGFVWQLCAIPPNAEHLDFRAIQAFDNNTAILMSSGKGDPSRLYKTTDGCQTWTLLFTNPDKDGFWDDLRSTRTDTLIVLGDPVKGRDHTATFRMFFSMNAGDSWNKEEDRSLFTLTDSNGTPIESIFAASNSSFLSVTESLFITGGKTSMLHYAQFLSHPPSMLCKHPCTVRSQTSSALATGETAGGFSIAANRANDSSDFVVVGVGGDYKRSDSSVRTASICRRTLEGIFAKYSCEPSATPPQGYRSAVAYDPTHNTWITVGPNGTDISTDDGRNWRPLKPNPTPTSTGTPSPSPSS